jgi:hypothetical protein
MIEEFLKNSNKERGEIIDFYAKKTGVNFDIIEKDIWVCYALDKIFTNDNLKDKIVFKGGTSLSKAYHILDRFSEDVDLGINKDVLDIKGSSKRPEKIAHRLIEATKDYAENFIYPELKKTFESTLKKEDWSLTPSKTERDVFLFKFPSAASKDSPIKSPDNSNSYGYITRNIRLEFKALGEVWPSKSSTIKPYIKEIVPDLFMESKVEVIDLRRTFIEKLFILDSIAKRPEDKSIRGDRFSRHYYDVYSIIKSGKVRNISKNKNIFNSVIENRKIFPRESWVDYDKIKSIADLKLTPSVEKIELIKKDYSNMKSMFLKSNNPDFNKIIETIEGFHRKLSRKKQAGLSF